MSKAITFEEHWSRNWKPTGQPAAFDAAMREVALAAWNAAIQSSVASLTMTRSEVLLSAGEMTAGEMRTVQAVLNGRKSIVQQFACKPT
jgi:hypothetical protein